MELTIDKETVEIIDRYMYSGKPKTAGLERICINKMRDVAVVLGMTEIEEIKEDIVNEKS